MTFDELMGVAKELSDSGPWVRDARVHDHGAWVALKEHAEVRRREQQIPDNISLLGFPIIEDANVPPGVLRLSLTDDTTKDLRIT